MHFLFYLCRWKYEKRVATKSWKQWQQVLVRFNFHSVRAPWNKVPLGRLECRSEQNLILKHALCLETILQ